jgi:hypothetical protein
MKISTGSDSDVSPLASVGQIKKLLLCDSGLRHWFRHTNHYTLRNKI